MDDILVLELGRAPRLGGIVYSLLGAASNHLEDFGNYYQHSSVSEINTVLDHLFLDTCSVWYANPGMLQPYNLTKDYQQMFGFTVKNIEHALLELQKYVRGGQKLCMQDF